VRVFQLVAEDTVEDRVLDIQKKKEKLISQAFSGNKNAPKEKEKIGSFRWFSPRVSSLGPVIYSFLAHDLAESRINDIAHIFGL
jgi:hypothetical protein